MKDVKCREGDLALIIDTVPGNENKTGLLVIVSRRVDDDPEWGPKWFVSSWVTVNMPAYANAVTDITLPPAEGFEHPDALLMPFGTQALKKWALEQATSALDEVYRVRNLFLDLALDEADLSGLNLDDVVKEMGLQTYAQ